MIVRRPRVADRSLFDPRIATFDDDARRLRPEGCRRLHQAQRAADAHRRQPAHAVTGFVPPAMQALEKLANAFRLQQAGRLDDAEALYASLLAESPDDAVALINGGALALARNDVATAVARLEHAAAQVPNNAVARNNLGFALLRAGRSREALTSLDHAIRLDPKYAQAHNNRGVALTHLGRSADAIAAFDRALVAESEGHRRGDQPRRCARRRRGSSARERRLRCGARARCVERPGACRRRVRDGARRPLGRRAAPRWSGSSPSIRASDVAWQTLGAVANWSWSHERAEAAFRRAVDARARQPRRALRRRIDAPRPRAPARRVRGVRATRRRRARFADAASRNGPRGRASPIDATLLVYAEQGLGDIIQFARFLRARARARVARLVLLLDGYAVVARAAAGVVRSGRRDRNRRRRSLRKESIAVACIGALARASAATSMPTLFPARSPI